MISASQLYDFVHCPHRVALDLNGDQAQRDEPNGFLELLWEQGVLHEAEVVGAFNITTNLRGLDSRRREQETLAAMDRGDALIYGGRLSIGDLVGEPDLLEKRGTGYIPGDIKAGSGFEGEEGDGKLKKHYAYQLAHYVYILELLGKGDGSREAFVIDRNHNRISYVLTEQQNSRNLETWWESYIRALEHVRAITVKEVSTIGALCGECKICHWHSYCKRDLIEKDDLTLIAELGRTKRDVMFSKISTVKQLAATDPEQYIQKKKTDFSGIGPDTLRKLHERAKLLATPGATPYLKGALTLPVAVREVYFDVEWDPMRDVVYLHGFVERLHGRPETAKYLSYFASDNTPAQEEAVFREAWTYLQGRSQDSVVYYYSKAERTVYRKLAIKYSTVTSLEDVNAMFGLPTMVDLLYDVVVRVTEWPTNDRSIKTLAQYLGFNWRDTHPSGTASIEWYHRWIESADPAIRQRILDYNEDDCLATGVVVDAIRRM